MPHHRRTFLSRSAIGLAGSAWALRTVSAAGVNDRVRVAVLGAGGQGKAHAKALSTLDNVEIVHVCDVDSQRLAQQVAAVSGAKGHADLRRVLDDPALDAVTIALPDHWHAPAAILAMEAGKHVYVEKPCSHNLAEGRMLVNAAARYRRVVAHGTQARSSPGIREAIEKLHEGIIGNVLIAKCWNCQLRENIGRNSPSEPPPGVDYDAWVGPAEWLPYQANRFHYNWHWWHNFGTGDLGNDGCHEFDLALWGLGVETHPSIVSAGGGKYFFDDDQQFPDTAQVTLEWPGDGSPLSRKMLVYEQRLWSTNYPNQVDSGVEFLGDQGRMFLSKRGKFAVYGPRNAPLEVRLENPVEAKVASNLADWIECIRNGSVPQASIEIAHRTAAALHLGNVALRVGRTLRFDPATEQLIGDNEGAELLSRKYRDGGHWGVPKPV